MLRRVLTILFLALVAAELALCAGAYWAMRQPPAVFGRNVARLPMPLMLAVPFETLWTRARDDRAEGRGRLGHGPVEAGGQGHLDRQQDGDAPEKDP